MTDAIDPKGRWSFSTGERGINRVRAFERGARGIVLEYYEPRGRGEKPAAKQLSLGHSDRERAKAAAEALAVELRGNSRPRRSGVTLGVLFEIYLRDETPKKALQTQQHDQSCAELFLRVFGDVPPDEIALTAWNDFIIARRDGIVRPHSVRRSRKVRNRVIAYDLRWLLAVLNWAASPVAAGGKRLLPSNPLTGFPMPKEESPRRPRLNTEQYASLLTAADAVSPLFRLALVLTRETGHRIGAVRQLRWSDVDLAVKLVTWREESDKVGFRHETPLTEEAIAALDGAAAAAVLAGRAASGGAYIFSPDGAAPFSRHMLNGWWRRAAKLADLPTGKRLGWHSLRRAFATELKATPLTDLAALGGWKATKTILDCYMQPDADTMREALEKRRPAGVFRPPK